MLVAGLITPLALENEGISSLNDIYIPYVYLIGWSDLNIWYYGSEYSNKRKIANPKNLWTIYFTSSKVVKEFRNNHGEPDVIQIRRIFKSRDECVEWEHKVLRRMKVIKSDRWLNKTDNKAICNSEEHYKRLAEWERGRPKNRTPEGIESHRKAMTNRTVSDETRKTLSIIRKNYRHPQKTKDKMSATHKELYKTKPGNFTNKKHSDETKQIMSEKAKANNPGLEKIAENRVKRKTEEPKVVKVKITKVRTKRIKIKIKRPRVAWNKGLTGVTSSRFKGVKGRYTEDQRKSISEGVRAAQGKMTKEQKESMYKNRDSCKGKIWIYKNDEVKRVIKEELDEFLTNGWIKGRKKKDYEF